MENVLLLLVLLACPVGMGLMMLFMGKGMFGSKEEPQRRDEPSLLELKNEQARLHEQIDRLEDRGRQPGRVPSANA